ncbi:MAG TPA: hypothetical protein VG268_14075 [Streptosporangiaceae bacterium]|nr:hypothetical protein [Streptosporangiaceae bacterium]
MPEEGESGTIEQRPAGPRRTGRRLGDGVERTLIASLRLAYLPVAFLLLSALASFVYAVAVLFNTMGQVAGHPFPDGHHIGSLLLVFDLFLIGSTALVLAVSFVEQAVDSSNGPHILELGGGVTAVILALTVFLRWGNHTSED